MANSMKKIVLQHWFGVDKLLFDNNVKSSLSKELLEDYLTTKGAFLANLFEIYVKIGADTRKGFGSLANIVTESEVVAKSAKKRASTLLESSSVIGFVKDEIKEIGNIEGLSESQVARYVVMKRRNSIAIDSMVLESYLSRSAKKKLEDWKGSVLLDAHKTLRNSMIDLSFS